ncbi:AAA family ATPase [Aquibacillus halophilus]|uniref:AAA family ATPase n=1 Tax=Aquibacillus halophilus TaxID=930132 RepID=A0A6A8DIM4_9BACI|nr:AAA family ATPase [Aquibacillus halophilus]MRH44306.1 AAA family ATPase [Aquibacillus halophilus]
MSVEWYFYSDINASAKEIETILKQRQFTLKRIHKLEDLHLRLRQTKNSVLFLKANTVYNVYDLCQEISAQYPHAYIIIIVPDNMENTKKAMHVGASNILRFSSELEETKEVIIHAQKYMYYRSKHEDLATFDLEHKNSKVIAVTSPKGGIGRTTLAVNLAAAFTKQGEKVALVDANLQFGEVAIYCDIKPKETIYEWIKEGYDREDYTIQDYLTKHESGVHVLAAPPRPEFFESITEEHFNTAIDELRKMFSIIIIDTPAYLSEIHVSCLEQSNEIILLTTSSLPVLRSSKLYIDTLETMQLQEKVKLVVNRQNKKSFDTKKIEELLEKDIFASLPDQENVVNNSINQGVPFVLDQTRSPLTKAVMTLMNKLIVQTEPKIEPRKKQKRWFSVTN